MKKYTLLICIVIIAAFLRFFQLGQNPPSLTWDEVAWGYNAYSLGIDGRDEFGKFLPYQYLESFGDFKPPVYAYLDILPIKIFGLNEFATRFPSALFGTLSVLMTYFLTKKIFEGSVIPARPESPRAESGDLKNLSHLSTHPSSSDQSSSKRSWTSQDDKGKTHWTFEIGHLSLDIPIIATTLLALSPWHIMLSRAAFEANIASFLIITGVYCFLQSLDGKKYTLILSAICFVLSIYTFNSARVLAPLLVIVLVIGTWKKLWHMKKIAIIAGIVGFLLLLPTVKFLLSPQASLRFKEVNIFSDLSVIDRTNQEVANDHNASWSKLIHNRRLEYGVDFLKHYFDNLSPSFLFITGDGNPKFSTQTTGQLFLWELPFLLPIGIFFLFQKREGYWWLIPIWLLLAIIPAALARETPHALRTEGTLPTFQILIAYGLINILLFLKTKKYPATLQKTAIGLLLIIVVGNTIYNLHDYYAQYPITYSSEWQYGYKDAITYIWQQQNNYDKIYLTGVLGRPYIYTLFYTQYDPQKFRQNATIQRDTFGFVHVKSFDKYIFGENQTDRPANSLKQLKTLYVDIPQNLPKQAKIKQQFYLKDGKPALVAYTI